MTITLKKPLLQRLFFVSLWGFFASPQSVWAAPEDFVFTPRIEEGEFEVDLRSGQARRRDGRTESALAAGIGYGFTPWWHVEANVKQRRETPERWRYSAWEVENKFWLNPASHSPVQLGFVIEIERFVGDQPATEVRAGPLIEAIFTPKVAANLNLLWEKRRQAGSQEPVVLDYQWQLKHQSNKTWGFGVQGFGSPGPWRHNLGAAQQDHRIGPAVFASGKVAGWGSFKGNAAWLWGTTPQSPKQALRLQVEWQAD